MRIRFWRRRSGPWVLTGEWDDDILAPFRVVDCSDLDVRMVADRQPVFPNMELRHPDLWFDGRWEDGPPPDRKLRRDMHTRVGAAPFLGGEFGRAMDEPFMPRLEALT